MIKHKWEFISSAILLDLNIDVHPNIDNLKHGSYVCSRCNDRAYVLRSDVIPDTDWISINWDGNCDEEIIKQIHEL